MEMSGQLYPWDRAPATHWIWGWVGPRASLDMVVVKKKISHSLSGLEPPIIQPTALSYTIELSWLSMIPQRTLTLNWTKEFYGLLPLNKIFSIFLFL
jgi:hypothetical protein